MNRPEVQNKGPGAALHSDRQRRKDGASHKGIMRTVRENKRREAEERNEKTAPERRRSARRGKGTVTEKVYGEGK